MKFIRKYFLYVTLVAASALFLYIEHVTHIEFMLHAAAIPLEILFGALIIKKYLERKEKTDKLKLLMNIKMYVKSYLFRSEMRNLFIANIKALKYPLITMSKIKNASLEELRQMRKDADQVEYVSLEAMEPTIMEYVKAYQVFYDFMELAINYNFEAIFHDMVYILHFIQDVRLFKQIHPDKLFIYEAEKKPLLMAKTRKVLGDGIRKFLDYMIELKEEKPEVFYEIMSDYEISSQIR